jgi:hydroxymethylbilane synthase
MNRKLKLGTRGSDLARTQATTIADRLRAHGADIELEIIRTSGDQSDAPSFASIGPQGVFVREIEQALLDKRVDLAVHSFKDLPTRSPAGLVIAAVPARVDVADVLLVRQDALDVHDRFIPLRRNAKVGTSSARRQAWLRHFRHDLQLAPLRGNVPTRLGRLVDGDYDAILLAAAGLERLRAEGVIDDTLPHVTELRLDPSRFVPAPAQGALAVQCRALDAELCALLAHIDDSPTHAAIAAERDALAHAEGGCDVAFGAYCVSVGGDYELTAMLERSGQVHTVAQRAATTAGLGADTWSALARTFSST